MGAVEPGFDELHSIFDVGGSKGLPEYSVEKIPKIKITCSNNVDNSGDRISCSVCLQVLKKGILVILSHVKQFYLVGPSDLVYICSKRMLKRLDLDRSH